MNKDPGKV